MEVAVFVTDIGTAAEATRAGRQVLRVAPRTTIPTADAALGLNGALISHFADRPMTFEDAPLMSDAQWQAFLDRRLSGRPWKRWFGKTPTAIYSVVVAF